MCVRRIMAPAEGKVRSSRDSWMRLLLPAVMEHERFRAWRETTFRELFKLFAVLNGVAVLLQYPFLTYRPELWEHLLVWGSSALSLLAAFLPGLPLRLRAWCFFIFFYSGMLKQLLMHGLESGAPVFLFALPAAAYLLFGRRAGLAAAAGSTVVALAMILLSFLGLLPLPGYHPVEPFNAQRWTEVGIALVGGMLLLLFILGRYAQLMAELRTEAERKADDRDVLIQEIHHRVKNNLQIIYSLLNLQIESLEEPEPQSILRESQFRIHSMALVYEQLHESENMRMVDLEWYLDALTSTITATALPSDKAIELQVSAAGIQLSAEIITPLGLIVNELVTNSLKHGFKEREKGRVSIAASRREGAIRLIYRDNGCGYPDIQDRSNEHALGMRLIEGLAEQIDAQLSVSGENGFVCTLAFPDQAE